MYKEFKLALVALSIFVSCKTSNIIPEKDMVSILAKINILDATVIQSDLRRTLFDKDTIDYYGKTIQSFGYTSAQFDSSLKFYSKNPKELDDIYDKVILELLTIETNLNVKSDNLNRQDSTQVDTLANLWNIKTTWQIPEDGIDNHIYFKIPVEGFGRYTFSADFQVFPDDKSVKPRMNIYFYYDDQTPTGKLSQIEHRSFQQDGVMRNIQIHLDLRDHKVTHITGYLLDNGNDNGKVNKHVNISNIRISFKPLVPKLRKALEKESPA